MNIDDKLLEFFYKWHRYEKQNNIDIIDFDLIQQGDRFPGAFADRQEVEKQLAQLMLEYRNLSQRSNAVSAKLEASRYYLSALNGKKIPFSTYVEKTMGVRPRLINEDFLQDELMKLKAAYAQIGYTWDRSGLDSYARKERLTKDEIEKDFNDFRDQIVPRVLEWLGLKIELNYSVQFVNVNEYWTNWTSTDDNGNLLLRFNMNERQKWVKGLPEYQVFHEICGHAIQAAAWKLQIQKGTIPPVIGLTSVFSPEAFTFEGVGQTLYYFYPDDYLSKYGLVCQYEADYFYLVWNNAHIMANKGRPRERIAEYIQSYLPNTTMKDIETGIRERTQEPLGRTYQYVYGITSYYHMLLANKLGDVEKKDFILNVFNHAYTPTELLLKYNVL